MMSLPGRSVTRILMALCALLSVVLWHGPGRAMADTQVTSNITTNTTWTSAGSPYVISSGHSVTSSATLTIQPGTTVEFSGQVTSLTVDGNIVAQGTQASPVVFTSVQDPQGTGAAGQYSAVNVDSGNSNSSFSHVIFRYGGYGSGGFYSAGALEVTNHSSVHIDHGDFEHNQ
jgi:hypothetical protein